MFKSFLPHFTYDRNSINRTLNGPSPPPGVTRAISTVLLTPALLFNKIPAIARRQRAHQPTLLSQTAHFSGSLCSVIQSPSRASPLPKTFRRHHDAAVTRLCSYFTPTSPVTPHRGSQTCQLCIRMTCDQTLSANRTHILPFIYFSCYSRVVCPDEDLYGEIRL